MQVSESVRLLGLARVCHSSRLRGRPKVPKCQSAEYRGAKSAKCHAWCRESKSARSTKSARVREVRVLRPALWHLSTQPTLSTSHHPPALLPCLTRADVSTTHPALVLHYCTSPTRTADTSHTPSYAPPARSTRGRRGSGPVPRGCRPSDGALGGGRCWEPWGPLSSTTTTAVTGWGYRIYTEDWGGQRSGGDKRQGPDPSSLSCGTGQHRRSRCP